MTDIETYIRKIADKDARLDDEEFMVDDFAGGNIDDAFSIGLDEGEIAFARELVKKFFS